MERDYWYTAARDAATLESAEDRRQKSGASGRSSDWVAARFRQGTSPVLFSSEVARGFIGHAIGAIAGGAQYRRSSFLLDAAGEQVFPEFMQIQAATPHPRRDGERSL